MIQQGKKMNIKANCLGLTLLLIVAGCGDSGGSSSTAEQEAILAKAQAATALAEAKAAQAVAEAQAAKAQAEAQAAKAQAEAQAARAQAAQAAEAQANAKTSNAPVEVDPVKQLSDLAGSVAARRQITLKKPRARPLIDSDRLWGKQEYRVANAAFDVKKTDSLVTPLTGIITITGEEISFGHFKTEAQARAANVPQEKNREELIFNFAWQSGRWVFKSGLRKDLLGALKSIGDNRPGWPLQASDWPFTPIKAPGQTGRFDHKVLLDE